MQKKQNDDAPVTVKRSIFSQGLRKRWVRGSMLLVIAALIIVIGSFSVFFYSYYYSTVRTGLEAKAKTATDFFTNHYASSYSVYYESAYRYTETFSDAHMLELQFIDKNGRLVMSSLGLPAGTLATSQEVRDALATGEISSWVGSRSSTGERIMAAAAPMVYSNGEVIGVMRFITGLKKVDRQVATSILAVAGICSTGVLLVFAIALFFIKSVIAPVGEITQMSRRIAGGSYGIQIENIYRDEMGEMVESINEMSLKIAQSERVKSEFISSISHELRTPLTAITGWGETLVYNESLDEDTSAGISIMLKEARRLTDMVEELLEFTRMEDGRFTLNIEPVDLAAELEDSILAYRELFNQDDFEIYYTPCPDAIPLIPADPNRLRQVFLNLFDNATKYGFEGKRLDIGVEKRGEFIVVIVRDFGPGIPEDELGNVKMKFYKGSSSKERGSGIGLSVCDEIIRYHGGRLELENADGGGLRVTIWLPMTNVTTLEDSV